MAYTVCSAKSWLLGVLAEKNKCGFCVPAWNHGCRSNVRALRCLTSERFATCNFGSFYIVYACWKDRSAAFLRIHYFTAESFLPLLYLILFSLIFFFFLFGKKLLEYDSFSHWGLIVKILLQKNRFPNFMEENYLMFQEYPLGSATYIYC